MALSVVINALAIGDLDPKRATAMLYRLQLAGMNIPRVRTLIPKPEDVIRVAIESVDGFPLAQTGARTEDINPTHEYEDLE